MYSLLHKHFTKSLPTIAKKKFNKLFLLVQITHQHHIWFMCVLFTAQTFHKIITIHLKFKIPFFQSKLHTNIIDLCVCSLLHKHFTKLLPTTAKTKFKKSFLSMQITHRHHIWLMCILFTAQTFQKIITYHCKNKVQ